MNCCITKKFGNPKSEILNIIFCQSESPEVTTESYPIDEIGGNIIILYCLCSMQCVNCIEEVGMLQSVNNLY